MKTSTFNNNSIVLHFGIDKLTSLDELKRLVWNPIYAVISKTLNEQVSTPRDISSDLLGIQITLGSNSLYFFIDKCSYYLVGFGTDLACINVASTVNEVAYQGTTPNISFSNVNLLSDMFYNAKENILPTKFVTSKAFFFFTYLLSEAVKSDVARIGMELHYNSITATSPEDESNGSKQILKNHQILVDTDTDSVVDEMIGLYDDYKNYSGIFTNWKKVATFGNHKIGDLCTTPDYRSYLNQLPDKDAKLRQMRLCD